MDLSKIYQRFIEDFFNKSKIYIKMSSIKYFSMIRKFTGDFSIYQWSLKQWFRRFFNVMVEFMTPFMGIWIFSFVIISRGLSILNILTFFFLKENILIMILLKISYIISFQKGYLKAIPIRFIRILRENPVGLKPKQIFELGL